MWALLLLLPLLLGPCNCCAAAATTCCCSLVRLLRVRLFQLLQRDTRANIQR
jgi:hypothetical protein